ncbi:MULTISPECIES: hypothetical protein [unclassified Geobacillus]|uniref:Uncharacterized protein n=1 Tax=Geobacillus sp. (strain WCH70) TaxID=471223 RepID=C5D8D1_GEOSW|nr:MULTISPECIES: hypothetical protein [unclassified Geobacillus]PUF87839.1 hypothetical protein DCC82_01220 [Geobacillus sp. LYN3]RDV22511.1 hypothetical protein DXK91_08080 [Parageobacillus toebii]TXK88693.1 hypothetical protein FVE68_03545 [Geobacillus sp. AYS3]
MEEFVEWFVHMMKSKFGVEVQPERIGSESTELYHDEIDEALIPPNHLEKLPDPLLFQTLIYIDEEENEWIAGIVINEFSKEWLYIVWLKNGEAVSYSFLD